MNWMKRRGSDQFFSFFFTIPSIAIHSAMSCPPFVAAHFPYTFPAEPKRLYQSPLSFVKKSKPGECLPQEILSDVEKSTDRPSSSQGPGTLVVGLSLLLIRVSRLILSSYTR